MSLLNFSSFSFSQDNDQGIVSHMPRDYAVAKKIGLILGVSLLQHVIINIFIQPSYFPKESVLYSLECVLVRLHKIVLFQWIFEPGPLSSVFAILVNTGCAFFPHFTFLWFQTHFSLYAIKLLSKRSRGFFSSFFRI